MKPPFSTAVGWLDPATVLKTQVLKACRDGHHSVSWSPMSRVVFGKRGQATHKNTKAVEHEEYQRFF